MKKNVWGSSLFFILSAVLGMLLLVTLMPSLVTVLPRTMTMNRIEAERLGEKYLQSWGYTPSDYGVNTTFELRKDLLRYVELQFLPQDRQEAFQSLPVYYWQVRWRRPQDYHPMPGLGQGRFPENYTEVFVQFDHLGSLVAFWFEQEEDSLLTLLSDSTARVMADSVLRERLGDEAQLYEITRARNSTLSNRIEHLFSYTRTQPKSALQQQLNIGITGSRISKFAFQYNTATTGAAEKPRAIEMIPLLFTLALVAILCLVIFVRRLRIDAINFHYAAVPAGLIALCTMVMMNIESSRPEWIYLLFGTILSMGAVALAMAVAAGAGESILRQVASDKLLTLDSLFQRQARHRVMAQAILRGLCMGIGLAGLVTLAVRVTAVFVPVSLVDWSAALVKEASTIPFLYSLVRLCSEVLWWQFAVILVIVPLLLRYTQKSIWVILPTALVFAFAYQNQMTFPSDPVAVSMVIAFSLGAAFVAIFTRYDFITVLITHFSFVIILSAVRLCAIEHPSFELSGVLLLLIPLLLCGFALWAWKVPKRMEELRNYLPPHTVKIIENDRLKRELEIAQKVQMSFLPKSNPSMDGLEIASICIPASEVGGDYYDFIRLDEHRLGFAIGDVSGKGISAAFYMTLTKGFLRSLSRLNWSPRQVMIEINSLFYESVDRGHFISLVFGVIDLKKKVLTFARAGHNPIIWQRRDNERFERLSPPGIALGLEPGIVFSEIIQEQAIRIESGDRFVLYTDGFSEAMNPISGEFGEDRLDQSVRRNASVSAQELLEKIIAQVQHFVGQHPQHDDMTMVILHIL